MQFKKRLCVRFIRQLFDFSRLILRCGARTKFHGNINHKASSLIASHLIIKRMAENPNKLDKITFTLFYTPLILHNEWDVCFQSIYHRERLAFSPLCTKRCLINLVIHLNQIALLSAHYDWQFQNMHLRNSVYTPLRIAYISKYVEVISNFGFCL